MFVNLILSHWYAIFWHIYEPAYVWSACTRHCKQSSETHTRLAFIELWQPYKDYSPPIGVYLRGLSEGPRSAGPKDRRCDCQQEHTQWGGHVSDRCNAPHLVFVFFNITNVCVYAYCLDNDTEDHCTRMWRTLPHWARTAPFLHLATRNVHITGTVRASFSQSQSHWQAAPSALEMAREWCNKVSRIRPFLYCSGHCRRSVCHQVFCTLTPLSVISFGPAHRADLGWGSERHPPSYSYPVWSQPNPQRAPSIDSL
jgi:hypothetical protein